MTTIEKFYPDSLKFKPGLKISPNEEFFNQPPEPNILTISIKEYTLFSLLNDIYLHKVFMKYSGLRPNYCLIGKEYSNLGPNVIFTYFCDNKEDKINTVDKLKLVIEEVHSTIENLTLKELYFELDK